MIGKQWMWKVEHAGGQREIDALHLPVGRPIELVMTSEDVIHDFSIPAFRIKHDVLPGRYETLWFTADRPGTYHLFCTQLCGTSHADMVGQIVAMTALIIRSCWSKMAPPRHWRRQARHCSCVTAAVAVMAATEPAVAQAGGSVRAPPPAGRPLRQPRTPVRRHPGGCR